MVDETGPDFMAWYKSMPDHAKPSHEEIMATVQAGGAAIAFPAELCPLVPGAIKVVEAYMQRFNQMTKNPFLLIALNLVTPFLITMMKAGERFICPENP